VNNRRTGYLIRSATHYFGDHSCPYCRSRSVSLIDRKYIVTRLFECQECHLYFRHPKDEPGFNADFYQEDYEEFGLTTHIPPADILEVHKKNNFKDSGKDYSSQVAIIGSLFQKRNLKIIDYGASWGYASFQFRNAGFEVQSYEISRLMAKKGNELLGLDIKTEVSALGPGNDVFYSSHVIEHIPDIAQLIQTASKLLSENGLFIAYSPNGSKPYREKQPEVFSSFWGMVHPNFLNADFYSTIFKKKPYIITSCPYNNKGLYLNWDQNSQVIDQLSGDELLVICAINKKYSS
jgi:hypothetical protein